VSPATANTRSRNTGTITAPPGPSASPANNKHSGRTTGHPDGRRPPGASPWDRGPTTTARQQRRDRGAGRHRHLDPGFQAAGRSSTTGSSTKRQRGLGGGPSGARDQHQRAVGHRYGTTACLNGGLSVGGNVDQRRADHDPSVPGTNTPHNRRKIFQQTAGGHAGAARRHRRQSRQAWLSTAAATASAATLQLKPDAPVFFNYSRVRLRQTVVTATTFQRGTQFAKVGR